MFRFLPGTKRYHKQHLIRERSDAVYGKIQQKSRVDYLIL